MFFQHGGMKKKTNLNFKLMKHKFYAHEIQQILNYANYRLGYNINVIVCILYRFIFINHIPINIMV